MYQKVLVAVLMFILGIQINYAQSGQINEQRSQTLAAKLSQMTPQQFREGHLKLKTRRVSEQTEKALQAVKAKKSTQSQSQTPKSEAKGLTVPADLRVPGEFEELDAVFINWPYNSLDTLGNWAEQLFENIGPYYDNSGNYTGMGPIVNIVDTFANSDFPPIFSKIINAIQPQAQVWINIWDGSDSVAVKNYMSSHNMPLTNYKFFVAPGNSFWYRDCGPVGFYYGANDDVAFLDFEYYGGRPLDDKLPIKWGAKAGYPVYTTTLEYEGGNLLADGAGTLFTSTAVNDLNGDTDGLYYLANPNDPNSVDMIVKTALTTTQVKDSLMHLMNLSRAFVLPALQNDGGTGHIDLYADMWDENTFVTTAFPTAMSSLADYTRVNNNVATIISNNTMFNKPYINTTIPLPSKDNGSWYTSGSDFENYTRTYSNHVIVNKTIIQPVFSDGVTGNVSGLQSDVAQLQKQYPGYNIVPVDVRAFDGFGGAIHCITKQVPAKNPLLIQHDPIRGSFTATNFPLSAKIMNKSGIASAKVYWRAKGSSTWNNVALTGTASAFTGQITGNASATNDTIEYYISATSVNGKTITKPMTAPLGYYTFSYGSVFTGVEDGISNKFAVGDFFPNPASQKTSVHISGIENETLSITIIDAVGRILENDKINGNIYTLNASSFEKGFYFICFTRENGQSIIRKIVVE